MGNLHFTLPSLGQHRGWFLYRTLHSRSWREIPIYTRLDLAYLPLSKLVPRGKNLPLFWSDTSSDWQIWTRMKQGWGGHLVCSSFPEAFKKTKCVQQQLPIMTPYLHMLRTFQNWVAISQIWSLPEGRRGSWVKSLQTFWNKKRMKNCIFLL